MSQMKLLPGVAKIHADHRQMLTVSDSHDLARLLPTGLFPPLTYLQPARPITKRTVKLAGATFTVVEVEPKT